MHLHETVEEMKKFNSRRKLKVNTWILFAMFEPHTFLTNCHCSYWTVLSQLIYIERQLTLEMQCAYNSVPARFGKGQGAKEIGHNLVRERHIIGQFRARITKIRSQSSTWTKRSLGIILWAIDENMGINLQAFYKHFYTHVWKHKNRNYILYFFLN